LLEALEAEQGGGGDGGGHGGGGGKLELGIGRRLGEEGRHCDVSWRIGAVEEAYRLAPCF